MESGMLYLSSRPSAPHFGFAVVVRMYVHTRAHWSELSLTSEDTFSQDDLQSLCIGARASATSAFSLVH